MRRSLWRRWCVRSRGAEEAVTIARGENFLYVFKPSPAGDGPGCVRTACASVPTAPLTGGRAPMGRRPCAGKGKMGDVE
jgi:hypothetical protein